MAAPFLPCLDQTDAHYFCDSNPVLTFCIHSLITYPLYDFPMSCSCFLCCDDVKIQALWLMLLYQMPRTKAPGLPIHGDEGLVP
jgi:hypothetical protein